MIERVERYVFTLRPNQVDLLHRWAEELGETPEHLGYRLMMMGVSLGAAQVLGWTAPGPDVAANEHFQAEALAALREHFGLDRLD